MVFQIIGKYAQDTKQLLISSRQNMESSTDHLNAVMADMYFVLLNEIFLHLFTSSHLEYHNEVELEHYTIKLENDDTNYLTKIILNKLVFWSEV